MKDLNYYKNLEYPVRIERDPEGGFVASIPDLPGCMTFGESKQEALTNIEGAKGDWLESYYAIHGEAPEPRQPNEFSGKLLLRMPKYLHQRLHEQAEEEDVSLNQYIVLLLTERSVQKTQQVTEQWSYDLANWPSLQSSWQQVPGYSVQLQDPGDYFDIARLNLKSHIDRPSFKVSEFIDERKLNRA